MLAGCSSSALLSPRHRLRSEPPSTAAQFQACNYPMNTQRFDIACSSNRKEASRSQPIRPVGISVEKQIEPKRTACRSLKQSIRLPPLDTGTPVIASGDGFWEKGKTKSLKRFADEKSIDDVSRAKRKRADRKSDGGDDLDDDGGGRDSFWFSGEITNPNWFQTIVNEIAETGQVNDLVNEPSGSGSSSSDGHHQHSGFPRNDTVPDTATPQNQSGNNSRINNTPRIQNADVITADHADFELISLLAACVEAIGSKNIAETNHFIARLGELASPRGSAITRLVAYYTEALALRVSRIWPHVFNFSAPRECDRVFDDDSGSALRFLNQITPIPKFIHFTSNEILLRAFEGKDRIHVIDFDVKQGLQWPGFFQSLASRANPPSHVRITGVGESKSELNETGDRLAGFAEAMRIPFEFHPVVDRLEDVRLWMLHVKETETVAVNCVLQFHKLLYDGGPALRDFLRLIRSARASVVVMAEQEGNTNVQSMEARVVNSVPHYLALFDSIESSLSSGSAARARIEEALAREIRNLVACEGSDRIERHEEFGTWKAMMEQGGFRNYGVGEREAMMGEMLVNMYCCEGFGVRRRGGEAVTLSYEDRALYTVSGWSPVDVVFAGKLVSIQDG